MKRNKTTGAGRRLGATTLALVAAALTAAAFAAFSVAQSGDSNGGSGQEQAAAPFAGPPPGGGPGVSVMPSAEDRQAFEAFRQCMEDNGAEPPKPGDGPPEPPGEEQRAQIEKAFEACSDELPEGARTMPLPPPGGCDDHARGDRAPKGDQQDSG